MKPLYLAVMAVMLAYPALAHARATPEDEAAVRKVLADYAESWNRHDMTAFAQVFTPDVDYVNIGGKHWKGVR